ncbi:hypothetical protein [Streptomyces composti]|uniref:hypothetical protein n=1 Tax=Streptomyces composti TaxID=2720025 RepID=UPI0019D22FAF|nr:hypothetical protein [Streptomyces composti]
MPTRPSGQPAGPPPPRRSNRAATFAVVASATVVVACAAVAGYVLLGDGEGSDPGPAPAPPTQSGSRSPADSRGEAGPEPLVRGWKVVVNQDRGIVFDVPPEWDPQSADWIRYTAENDDPDEKPLVAMRAPAHLKEKWCTSDENRDGSVEDTPLASVGTRGNSGAADPREAASEDSRAWVYGEYAQPDRGKVASGRAENFTTRSGLSGTLASAYSTGVNSTKKCASDGKAWTFAFRDSEGEVMSVSLVGAAKVPGEVSEATVRKIMSTVRLKSG